MSVLRLATIGHHITIEVMIKRGHNTRTKEVTDLKVDELVQVSREIRELILSQRGFFTTFFGNSRDSVHWCHETSCRFLDRTSLLAILPFINTAIHASKLIKDSLGELKALWFNDCATGLCAALWWGNKDSPSEMKVLRFYDRTTELCVDFDRQNSIQNLHETEVKL